MGWFGSRPVSDGRVLQRTYIRVSTDLLDDILIEVAGVAQEAAGDVVGVLQTLEDLVDDGELRALAQLGPLVLVRGVDLLDPRVVSARILVLDVALELDDVGVRNLHGVDRGDDGCSVVVDGAGVEDRGS